MYHDALFFPGCEGVGAYHKKRNVRRIFARKERFFFKNVALTIFFQLMPMDLAEIPAFFNVVHGFSRNNGLFRMENGVILRLTSR